jgi:Flp pilus assembly protein TadB
MARVRSRSPRACRIAWTAAPSLTRVDVVNVLTRTDADRRRIASPWFKHRFWSHVMFWGLIVLVGVCFALGSAGIPVGVGVVVGAAAVVVIERRRRWQRRSRLLDGTESLPR